MKVLVAPDKFKGSLSAAAAASAISQGWRKAWPASEISLAPIADGGEGFAEVFHQALGAEWITVTAQDPVERPIQARYAWHAATRLAIIDMSEASGLWRLKREERSPLEAHTFGTGQLIRHAIEHGARKILIGLGGSATTDGGVGMAAALGYDFFTTDGQPLTPHPKNFLTLARIGDERALPLPEIIGACDVTNPLLGPKGTAVVFSPQKGAGPLAVEALELAMGNLAEVVAQNLGRDLRDKPGAGAAGGFGFGLLSFCHATLRSGFDLVAETLRLEDQIKGCDLVITGEGRLDGQTLDGKGPAGVAHLARAAGKPIIALAGSLGAEAEEGPLFDAALPIVDGPATLEEAMSAAAENLERAAFRAGRLIRFGAERLAATPGRSGSPTPPPPSPPYC
jgi:glycerate kinase